jgi:hypothetical protein
MLLRKPSGGERAESKLYWQVPESEPRNKLICLAENKAEISGLTQQFA